MKKLEQDLHVCVLLQLTRETEFQFDYYYTAKEVEEGALRYMKPTGIKFQLEIFTQGMIAGCPLGVWKYSLLIAGFMPLLMVLTARLQCWLLSGTKKES